MRKWICMVIAVMMMMSAAALADGETSLPGVNGSNGARFSAKGSVRAPDPVYVLAPMGGQIEDFAWVPGDAVEPDALAFAVRPTRVLAASDGVIRLLRAQPGGLAQDVIAQYGALCHIERQDIWRIEASSTGAYADPDNRDVRVGQRVRVQHGTGDDKVRGEAEVISVDGKDYVLELEQGDFEVEDSVKLYFETSKDNASKDQLGSGKIVRADAIKVGGEGMLARVLVEEGQQVQRGQVLFELDAPSAQYDDGTASAQARFPQRGLIGELLARPGAFAQQGQAVMTLIPTGALQITLEVDELDIAKVRLGDSVRVRVDAHPEERTGIVGEIRQSGQTVLDTTKFLVVLDFENSADLMIGMHATGFWD